jgi:dishevelled associated activator of morphogenesis
MGKASPPSLPPKAASVSASPPQGKTSPPSMVVVGGGAPPVALSFKKASPAIPSSSPKDENKKSSTEMIPSPEAQSKEPLPLGRKLHWKPLRNVESTIWATLEHEPVSSSLTKMTDFSGLKSVFDDTESVSQRKNSLAKIGGPAGNPANHVVTLLEGKRAQNIGVVVARVPIELLTTRLTSLDTDSLSIENLERIKMILPTEEETMIFTQFKGEIGSLRDIEQKVIGLFKLPRLSQRIKFCLVSLQLPATMSEVVSEIELLRKCASQVRQSKKLKKVLHVVLMLGNYLNRGETRGFSIESLSKLAEFKSSSDPGITTMHFLAARLLATDSSLTELIEEMPTLREVNRVTPESISQGVLVARNDAESIRNELKVHANHYSSESIDRMKKFLTFVEPRIQNLVADWSACEKDLVELRKYFGEDPKKISVEDFYGYLRNFCDSLLNAATELKKRPKKFEKIFAGNNSPEARKTPSPSPPAGGPSGAPPVGTTWGKVTTDQLVEASKKLKSKESVPGPVKVARSSGTDWNVVEKPSSPSQVKLRSNFPNS